MRRTFHVAASIKRLVLFAVSLAFIFYVYQVILPSDLRTGQIALSLIAGWAFSAYFVLPRIHRLLSLLYVPDYFIGRTRTADGLLGDQINLAFIGSKSSLRKSMKRAGWIEAEPLSLSSSWRMVWSIIRRREYPDAPMSDLLMFDRRQDLAFQKQVDGNPRKRHHVRFWRTDKNWYMPGGYRVDWVAAATYDSAVGLSMFTLQFTHRIDPNIDQERDYLVDTLSESDAISMHERIEHFFPPFITRNGSGDRFLTDGSMVIVTLKRKL
ncbi:LssY C-terminal domain-containing protein [Candidatus Saccharibacteria bacterium]|nr:LssY C-terminal domain-containing protein [Candidatus Saccharibacteria bacterium]